MLLSSLIIGLCIIFQRYVLNPSNGDKLEFSGNALLTEKQIWVLITGSMIHATKSHEINNLLFTFVVSCIAETQFGLSSLWIISVFTITGAIGWMTSFLYHYYHHGYLAYFIPARGYSPNMYGFAFFCMIVYPNKIIQSILFLDPVIWIILIIAVPAYFTNNKKHNPYIWTFICLMVCVIMRLIFEYTMILNDITMGGFLTLYFLKCGISFMYFVKYLGNPSASDHACHLGGSLCGILLGIFYLYYTHNKPWPYFRLDAYIWNAIAKFDFLCPFTILFIRLMNNM